MVFAVADGAEVFKNDYQDLYTVYVRIKFSRSASTKELLPNKGDEEDD